LWNLLNHLSHYIIENLPKQLNQSPLLIMASVQDQSEGADEANQCSLIETDDVFNAEPPTIISPIASVSAAPPGSAFSPRADPTFMQNQKAIQRLPSSSKSNKSSLSHQLSIKSNSSYDAGLSQSGIINVLAYGDARSGRGRGSSTGSVTDGIDACTLSKSLSTSARSTHSVRSVAAVGTHPFGTLGVHSGEKRKGSPSHECLLSGDVAIVTSMPPGSIFGFDALSLTLGKEGQFHGIREIPPGPHFLYAGSASEVSTRNGFWIMSQPRVSGEYGEVFVKRWDSYTETLEDEISDAEFRIQTENVPKVFNLLLPYNTGAFSSGSSQSLHSLNQAPAIRDPAIWKRLTSAIKGAMLTRITGGSWNKWMVASNHEAKYMEDIPTDAKDNVLDIAKDQQLVGKDKVLKFAFQRNGVTYSREVIGRARTEQALDTSIHIFHVIRDKCTFEDADEVIGELQFSYITGVLLGNIDCQEQWAHLVKVFFKAFRLTMDMPAFFRKIIEAVHAQLIFDEEGIEGSIFDNLYMQQEEFKTVLTAFKSRLNEMLLEKVSIISHPHLSYLFQSN
jgi:A1 cistron-splicing factor AAR2